MVPLPEPGQRQSQRWPFRQVEDDGGFGVQQGIEYGVLVRTSGQIDQFEPHRGRWVHHLHRLVLLDVEARAKDLVPLHQRGQGRPQRSDVQGAPQPQGFGEVVLRAG